MQIKLTDKQEIENGKVKKQNQFNFINYSEQL